MTQVLCITREVLGNQDIPYHMTGKYPWLPQDIPNSAVHWINRSVVDGTDPEHVRIGYQLPQLVTYVTIKNQDKYLSYQRKVTGDARLKGAYSIGFGGHIDIDDQVEEFSGLFPIFVALARELKEELDISTYDFNDPDFLLINTENEVSSVHVGYHTMITTTEDFHPNEEISNLEWKTKDQLLNSIADYELWSQMIIRGLP